MTDGPFEMSLNVTLPGLPTPAASAEEGGEPEAKELTIAEQGAPRHEFRHWAALAETEKTGLPTRQPDAGPEGDVDDDPAEVPTINVDPGNADQVIVYLPEFGYLDTQAWSMDVGIPAASLPALRDAIDRHLAVGPAGATGAQAAARQASAEQQVKRLDAMAHAWSEQLPETVRTATVVDAVHLVTRPNGERP